MIVTFYSFKGGVGRSMAVANVAEILAQSGYRVIVCDWDLEAPGLERYFIDMKGDDPFETNPAYEARLEEMENWPGLVDLLVEYKNVLSRNVTVAAPQEELASVGNFVLRRPSSFAREVLTKSKRGWVRLLSAGRRNDLDAYAEIVRNFSWREFYDEWAGNAWLDFFRDDLLGDGPDDPGRAADIVLIDSRTGLTEQSGVCTHHLADVVVLFTGPNRANIAGTLWMTRALRSQSLRDARNPLPMLLPVASRVEIVAEKEILGKFRKNFRQTMTGIAAESLQDAADGFLKDSEIPYVSFYSAREDVVARESADGRHTGLYDSYLALKDAIVQCGVFLQLLRAREEPRRRDRRLDIAAFEGSVLVDYGEGGREQARAIAGELRALGFSLCSETPDEEPAVWIEKWEERLRGCGGIVLVADERAPDRRASAVVNALMKSRGSMTKPIHFVRVAPDDISPDALAPARRLLSDASIFVPDVDPARSPYPGFAPFREEDSCFFFGRDADTSEVLRRIGKTVSAHAPRIVIHGPSHCGKTSFIDAGVVPALRRKFAVPVDVLRLVTGTTAAKDEIDVTWRLRGSLSQVIAERRAQGRAVVLLLRWNGGMAALNTETEALVVRTTLDALEQHADGNVILVIETRSAAVEAVAKLFSLTETECLEIGLLAAAVLPDVIQKPALTLGAAFAEGLVERIANDALAFTSSPGVICRTMQILWPRRRSNVIAHEQYSQIQGIGGVFIAEADALVDVLPPVEASSVKEIVLAVDSRTRLDKLIQRTADVPAPPPSPELVDLMSSRAIIQLRRNSLDFVDDRAINHWPRFVRWQQEDEQTLFLRRRLELEARRWDTAGKPRWALPTDDEIDVYSQVQPRSGVADRYLISGRRWRTIRHVARNVWIGLAVTSFLGGGYAIYERHARKAKAEALLVRSSQAMSTDPIAALTLALDAAKIWQSDGAKVQVGNTARNVRLLAQLQAAETVHSVAFSAGGSQILVGGPTSLGLYDLRTGRASVERNDLSGVISAAVTPAGNDLLVVFAEAPPQLWHLGHNASEIARIGDKPMTNGVFSRNGRRFVVASSLQQGAEGAVLLGDTELPEIARQPLYKEFDSSVGFRTDFSVPGDRLVSTGYGGWVSIWSILTRERFQVRAHNEAVSFLAISDSGMMATATPGGSIRIWNLGVTPLQDLASGLRHELTMPAASRGSAISSIALSPDGATLLVANEITMRQFHTTPDFRSATYGIGGATAIAFSPDGEQLAVGRSDGTLEVSNWRGRGLILKTRAHDGTVQKIVYGPDSRQIATVGRDHRVCVWSTGPPPEIHGDVIAFGKDRLPVRLSPPKGGLSESATPRSR